MTSDIAGAGSSVMTEHMARRRIAAAVHELRRQRTAMYAAETPEKTAQAANAWLVERAALEEALHTLTGFTMDELREVVG